MSLAGPALAALLAPALLAGLLARRWPASALGPMLGWIAGSLVLTGLPSQWPLPTLHRLPALALLALLLPPRPWAGALGAVAASGLLVSWAWARLSPLEALPLLALGLAAGAGLAWASARATGRGLSLAGVVALGAAAVLATGNATLGASGLALASATTGAALSRGLGAPPRLAVGLALIGLLEAGRATGRLSPAAELAVTLSLGLVGQPGRAWAPLGLALAGGAAAWSALG